MPGTQSNRWWTDQKAASDSLFGIARELYADTAGRRTRAMSALGLFEGRKFGSLSPLIYSTATGQLEDMLWNIPRSLCLTVQAKVAGRQKPKPQFLTTDADYRTARKAKKLDRFVEAQLHERQGMYESAWDLGLDVFLDAAIWGLGVIRVSANASEKRVQLTRKFFWELLVDPLEAAQGTPQNLFDSYWYDADKLQALYPEYKSEIENAIGYSWDGDELLKGTELRDRMRMANMVRVVEGFRLPIASAKKSGGFKGRHAIGIHGKILEWEDYERSEYPYVFLRWTKERMGFHATGLVEEVERITTEVNETLEQMGEAERLNNVYVDAEEDTITKPEQLESNEAFVLIERKKGSMPLQITAPNAFSESKLKWLQMHEEHGFSLSGISQLTASARKEKGITSALGLRALDDQQSERLSVIEGQYKQLFPALARHIVWCTRELFEDDPDLMVKWPGQGFLKEIKFSDVDVPENSYTIQIDEVAGITRKAAGRYSSGEELYNAGIISKEAHLRIRQLGDVERESNALQAQYGYVEELIERYLDMTPEELNEDPGLYEVPEPFLVHELAIAQVGQAYLEWKGRTLGKQREEAEFNLELLRRFIEECDIELQRKMQKLAELQNPVAQPAVAPQGMGAAPAQLSAVPSPRAA